MKNSDKSRRGQIDAEVDLGLSKLMSEPKFEGDLDIPSKQGQSDLIDEHIPNFEDWARSGNWQEIYLKSESALSKDKSDQVSTLWWVRSQIHLSTVPAAILVAPLDSITRDINPSISHSESVLFLASTVLVEMGEVLIDSRDFEFALVCLERAYRFSPKFNESILSLVVRAIDLVKSEKGGRSTSNTSILRDLEQFKKSLTSIKANNIQKESFNSESDSNVPRKDLDGQKNQQQTQIRSGLSLSRFLFAFLLIIIGGVVSYRFLLSQKSVNAEPMLGNTSLSVESPEFALPLTEREKAVSQLDLVLFDLEDRADKKAEQKQVSASAPVGTSIDTKKEKEILNVDGPIEPPGLLTGVREEVRKDPEQRDDLFRKPSDIRNESTRPPSPPTSTTFYQVIYETVVKERPSWESRTVAELNRGAKIEVILKMGDWLKIRSRKGNIGFIPERDTEQK